MDASTALVSIGRDAVTVSAQFLVKIQARPEVRRVFPPGNKTATPAREPAGSVVKPPPGKPASPLTGPARVERPSNPTPVPPSAPPSATDEEFAIQIAAVSDPIRARRLVEQLRSKGHQAYLVEPSPSDTDAPYRVRIGGFTSRAAAQKAAQVLERERAQKVWVVRER